MSDNGHTDAWKALIDFNKTTISIASAVLTALIGYLTVSGTVTEMSQLNLIPIGLLLLAGAFALYSFGRALSAIKNGTSAEHGVLYANAGFFSLGLGILSLALVSVDSSKSISEILDFVETETKGFHAPLAPADCRTIALTDDYYLLTYKVAEHDIFVTLTSDGQSIVKIE